MSDEKPDEKIVFCQVDAHLDTNPKIRRAGRDARDVFEFMLRRVAIARTEGTVPLKYIEPWYLADQLMMSEDDARNGVSRAVTASLLAIDEVAGVVRVVGWSHEWGRRPKTNGERQAEFRKRNSNKQDTGVTQSNGESREVTASNESNVREERRGEEIRRDIDLAAQGAQPSFELLADKVDRATGDIGKQRAKRVRERRSHPEHTAAKAHWFEFWARRTGGHEPTWNGKQAGLLNSFLGPHGLDEFKRRISLLEASRDPWHAQWDFAAFVAHSDRLVAHGPVRNTEIRETRML